MKRPRHYVARHWLVISRPFFRYSESRDAFVLRLVGRRWGPVLRLDRRRGKSFDGVDRRSSAKVA